MQNKKIICSIHQPNFFPWLGYFDKIKRSDIFVFMDDVAYPKSGSGCWCNRVKINIQNQASWLSCPVLREKGVQLIKDVNIDDSQPWRKKLLKTLEMNYKKTPNYSQTMDFLEPIVMIETNNLALFNINAIKSICAKLDIKTTLIKQSDLIAEGASTQLLINITKAVNADIYMCGGGAQGYQDDKMLEEQNIELIYQTYVQEKYLTVKPFMPGLSVIDYLMNA